MLDNQFIKDTWEVLDAQLSSTQGNERGMREAGYYLRSLRKRRGLSRTSAGFDRFHRTVKQYQKFIRIDLKKYCQAR